MKSRLATTADLRHRSSSNRTGFDDHARWCRKELAHIRCEHTSGVRLGEDLHRGRTETEAESVAHVCCRALGLDTQVYSDAYLLGWAKGDMELVKECAETILKVAKAILNDLTPDDATEPEQTSTADTTGTPTTGGWSGTRGRAGRGRRRAAGKRRATSSAGDQP